MVNFFANVKPEQAVEIEQLSQLIYELRQARNAVLNYHGVGDEAALLRQIETGQVDEHPAYEHYLAARILENTRETARALAAERLKEINK